MRKFGHFCYPDSYCAALPWRGAFWRKIMFEFTGILVSQNSVFLAKSTQLSIQITPGLLVVLPSILGLLQERVAKPPRWVVR